MKKTVVITGGSSGIGLSLVKKYCDKKYNVAVIDINDFKFSKSINNVRFYKADISDDKMIPIVMRSIYEDFKSIDVLINNASKQTESSLNNLDYKIWKNVIDINLNGTFLCIKEATKYMSKGSTILNIISVHYDKPRINKYHYDASKAGVAILTKELAIELANKNITINALSFGAVNTQMNASWINDCSAREKVLNKVPLKIIFEPSEIALFASSIIDNYSKYTTGSIFTIDGGRSLI